VLNWSGFNPFQLHLGLIANRSQSASCHIANRYAPVVEEYKETLKIENYDGFLEKIYGLRSRKKD